jgi:ABC-type lipoprotein release transport system permease subunit
VHDVRYAIRLLVRQPLFEFLLDPVVAVAVAAILGLTSVAAVLVPAQRAAAIEPLAALRAE